MIDKRIVQKLYNSLIKDGRVDLDGLTYTSEYNDTQNLIYIRISNPNNLSYSSYVIVEKFHETIYLFTKFIPNATFPGPSNSYYLRQFFKFYFDDGSKTEVHLNGTDTRRIKNSISNVTKIKYDDFESEINSEYIDITSDGDGNRIQIKIQLNDSYYDNEPVEDNKRLRDILDFLFNEISFSDYLDSRYNEVMDIVWSNELLTDKDYMYLDLDPRFYDHTGKRIMY